MIRKIDKTIKFKPISRYKLGYLIAWDFKYYIDIEVDEEGNVISEQENKDIATWMIEYFDTKPTIEQIKDLIQGYYKNIGEPCNVDWNIYNINN